MRRFADTKPAVSPPASAGEEPFLCFQRRTDDDLIVAGYKVVGSAQRRMAKAVLQHGSILLRASAAAPQLPGILDLTHCDVEETSLIEHWAHQLGEALGIHFSPAAASAAVIARGKAIEQERFQSTTWTDRRP